MRWVVHRMSLDDMSCMDVEHDVQSVCLPQRSMAPVHRSPHTPQRSAVGSDGADIAFFFFNPSFGCKMMMMCV
jgi:hypothetical protein